MISSTTSWCRSSSVLILKNACKDFAELHMAAQHKVVQDIHVHEEPQILKSPGNAPACNCVGGEP